ncbi:MAG: hypothetical protein J5915_02195 [Acidaminococcaceae bacterium]|nr:hypothetical protein [Acidaminococcaceae bacterium]
MHQAEKYIKQIVEEIGKPSYMQEFLKQGKDKKAVADVAEKLQQFSDNMSLMQPIAIKGFMVPSGSLMLYHYLKEELGVIETMLQQETEEDPTLKTEKRQTGKESLGGKSITDDMPTEQKEEMQKRVGIVKHRLTEMTESLLPQHIADQIEQRTDEAAAQSAFQEHGYLPLYVDEKTMGIVYNTLTMQLLLDRFNLIFEGVFAPMDQETVQAVLTNVLAPYWKEHGQSILFSMEMQK